ncbi:MAG TPA: hypothetical protein VF702_01815 [Allosphingosinicella sp.]|jgi:hypothetical protein
MTLIAAAFFAFAASSMPAGDARGAAGPDEVGRAALTGIVDARIDGRALHCQGVLLIPRSEEVDQEIARVFGTLDEGERIVRYREIIRRRHLRGGAYASGARESDCRDSYTVARFSFDNVPPGEYYVTAYLSPSLITNENELPRRGLDLMRRVTVGPGGTAEVTLTRP